MARSERIVAELGRPETPEEAASRKAASSYAYRSSKTFRNLVAALLVILGVLAVVIFAVPRGEPPVQEPIDVAAVAADVSAVEGVTALVPEVPADWLVNGAHLESGTPATWNILYVPSEAEGFVRVAQGFSAGDTWPLQLIPGAQPAGNVVIDGVRWVRYDIPNAQSAGNVSAALSTTSGADTVVIYGNTSAEVMERVAAGLSAQIISHTEETP